MSQSYAESKEQMLLRLRRIEGQIRGIARMVEQDKYCVDVLNQISAVRAGLDKVGLHLLSDHIHGCVRDAVTTPAGEEKVDELVSVVGRFLKT